MVAANEQMNKKRNIHLLNVPAQRKQESQVSQIQTCINFLCGKTKLNHAYAHETFHSFNKGFQQEN